MNKFKHCTIKYMERTRHFLYDIENQLVLYVAIPTRFDYEMGFEMLEHNGKNYVLIDSVGLKPSNWNNKGLREDYLLYYLDEFEEEIRCLMNDF